MVTITDSHVRATIYETIYDLINTDKSGYLTGSTGANPKLSGGYPDDKSVSFPLITVMPIDVGEADFTVDTSRSVSSKTIVVPIIIYSEKNKELDYMSDGITNTIRSNSFTGAYLVDVAEDTNYEFPLDQKLKSKTLTFTFMRR